MFLHQSRVERVLFALLLPEAHQKVAELRLVRSLRLRCRRFDPRRHLVRRRTPTFLPRRVELTPKFRRVGSGGFDVRRRRHLRLFQSPSHLIHSLAATLLLRRRQRVRRGRRGDGRGSASVLLESFQTRAESPRFLLVAKHLRLEAVVRLGERSEILLRRRRRRAGFLKLRFDRRQFLLRGAARTVERALELRALPDEGSVWVCVRGSAVSAGGFYAGSSSALRRHELLGEDGVSRALFGEFSILGTEQTLQSGGVRGDRLSRVLFPRGDVGGGEGFRSGVERDDALLHRLFKRHNERGHGVIVVGVPAGGVRTDTFGTRAGRG